MEGAHVTIDEGVLRAMLKGDSEIRAAMREAAEKIAATARDSAPVLHGDYKDAIAVEDTMDGARVVNSDEAATFIEFGVPTRGEPARFNLRHAVVISGFKFKKGGR
jgi:hypothetical protein